MNDVSAAIAKAHAHFLVEDLIAIQEDRYREAKAIVANIPSGTRDEDLTAKQRRALNAYEESMQLLRELRKGQAV